MGYQTSLNLKEIISIVSFKQNMNLKIQILAGNTLMSRFHVGFEIELPLTSLFQEQSKNFFLIVKLEVIPHRMSLNSKKIIDYAKKNISNAGSLNSIGHSTRLDSYQ